MTPEEERAFLNREALLTADTFDLSCGFVRPGRECRECGEMEMAQMKRDASKPDGHSSICIPCHNEWNGDRMRVQRDEHRQRTFSNRTYDAPGFVYRAFDSGGRLLYLGETNNVYRRLYWPKKGHADKSAWFSLAVRLEVTVYRSKGDAQTAESFALDQGLPPFNRVRSYRKRGDVDPEPLFTYSGPL